MKAANGSLVGAQLVHAVAQSLRGSTRPIQIPPPRYRFRNDLLDATNGSARRAGAVRRDLLLGSVCQSVVGIRIGLFSSVTYFPYLVLVPAKGVLPAAAICARASRGLLLHYSICVWLARSQHSVPHREHLPLRFALLLARRT